MSDFQAFIAAAHARGIRVIVDLVINHTSSRHPWFVESSLRAPKHDWSVWRADDPGWRRPGPRRAPAGQALTVDRN